MLLVDALLDLGNGLSGIQALGADFGAVHDGVTPVQLVGIIQLGQPLLGEVIPAVDHPSARKTSIQSTKLTKYTPSVHGRMSLWHDLLYAMSLTTITA